MIHNYTLYGIAIKTDEPIQKIKSLDTAYMIVRLLDDNPQIDMINSYTIIRHSNGQAVGLGNGRECFVDMRTDTIVDYIYRQRASFNDSIFSHLVYIGLSN